MDTTIKNKKARIERERMDTSKMERVYSVDQVLRLAVQRRSLVHLFGYTYKRLPASWYSHLQAAYLHNLITLGLFIYPKKGSSK